MANARMRVISLAAKPAATAASRRSLCTVAARLQAPWKPLYRRLSALGADPAGSVAATVDAWVGDGHAVAQGELLACVRELRSYKMHPHALELMDWMEAHGMKMIFGSRAIRLDLLSKVKGIHVAKEYFSNLPDLAKTKETFTALLNSYVEQKMADEAIALYEKMKELKLSSSTLVHNILMTLYIKVGQPHKALDVFQEMRESNTFPDNSTYCMLMQIYASMNDMESVEKVVQEAQQGVVPVHWSLYSNLADHYNKASQFKKAELALRKVEEVMDKSALLPYHFLISLYAGAGNLVEVKRVWESLKATFRKRTNKSYLVMLNALRKLDDFDSLKQCFEEWEGNHQYYDMRLANRMIEAYLTMGSVAEAEAVRQRALSKGCSDALTFDLFVNHYLKNCQMDLALTCLRDARKWVKQKDWKPKKEIICEFLKSFEESRDVDGLESFCECLKKIGCADADVYASLLRTYKAAGETNPSITWRVEEDGIEIRPDMAELLRSVSVGKEEK